MKILLLALLLTAGANCYAQNIQDKNIHVEGININEGLSQGMINCIWQDHFGFMWFGTMDGLNRFDGYKFQVFSNDPFDSSSISGNFITSIFEDSKGRLWIGTALAGLNLFVPEKEQFIHFTANTKPALTCNTIHSIQEDKFGAIWIGTESGLNKLTIPGYSGQTSYLNNNSNAADILPFIRIQYLPIFDSNGKELFTTHTFEPFFLITNSGTIWVSACNSLFKILPLQSGKEKITKVVNLIVNRPENTGSDKIDCIKIIEDTSRKMLYFKGKNCFTILNEKTGSTSVWDCSPLDMSTSRNQVICDNGILLERTAKGLIRFDLIQRKMYRMRSSSSDDDKILQTPFSIFKDRSGIIWIGTGGFGILKYNPRTENFNKVILNSITWMSATPSGHVLMTVPEIRHFLKDSSALYPSYTLDNNFNKKVMRYLRNPPDIVVQDNDGIFWFNVNGVSMFNPVSKSLKNLKNNGEVFFPYFLDNKSRLCFASQNSFCFFDKVTNIFTSFTFPITAVNTSLYKFCQVIYQDSKGIFWLGTTEGLFSFNEVNRQWRHYKKIPGDSTSISNNMILSICNDQQSPGEYLWIGTNGGGLNRLCIRTGKFEHIGIKEGLPSMVIYGLLADDDKKIWMSTNRGVACLNSHYTFDKAGYRSKILKNTFTCYYEENGLQSNEFNRNAYCKTKDGTLFFGGVNGFNYFNPKNFTENKVIPNVIITDVKISNKPVVIKNGKVTIGDNSKHILAKPVFLLDSITLPYGANMISFDFASLDFTASEKNLYQYKMEGLDKDWIQNGTNNMATYTNLDPGNYTFTVKGSNSDGVWNENGRSILLTIIAPWYMTWWFKFAMLAKLVALLYIFFRYRLLQKLKVLELRNSIANDLHDEIGSTLSSIYIYSEVARQSSNVLSPQTAKTNNYLKKISEETSNMMDALGDIVWTVDAKNDRFINIVNRLRAAAIELFEAKGYSLHLNFTEQLNTLRLGMAYRKNFYLFYKEAINNAAKYASGENIWITLSCSKRQIQLTIKDDGRGFAVNNKHSGNGIANMKKRAKELKGSFELNSSPGNGTEIKLVFIV